MENNVWVKFNHKWIYLISYRLGRIDYFYHEGAKAQSNLI